MRATTIVRWAAAAGAVAAVTATAAATTGEMFPVDICLTVDNSVHPCILHLDDAGDGWFLVNIESIHPDLPEFPFPAGTDFRVTGQYCLDCVYPFCGWFSGYIHDAVLVPCKDGDVTGDAAIDVEDLVTVMTNWGDCAETPASCAGDADDDGTVGVGDLVAVFENWGS